jgi:23S rRNA (pseudouridine1915-N3)-methyltransferase
MITLHCIGKIKKSYIKEGVDIFLKRISKYSKIEYKENSQFKELKGYSIALDPTGKQFDSEQFAKKINTLSINNKNITFIIGGPTGIPKETLNQCKETISLSELTFPNELVRLIFLEQLYRAFTIIKNEPYHKS